MAAWSGRLAGGPTSGPGSGLPDYTSFLLEVYYLIDVLLMNYTARRHPLAQDPFE